MSVQYFRRPRSVSSCGLKSSIFFGMPRKAPHCGGICLIKRVTSAVISACASGVSVGGVQLFGCGAMRGGGAESDSSAVCDACACLLLRAKLDLLIAWRKLPLPATMILPLPTTLILPLSTTSGRSATAVAPLMRHLRNKEQNGGQRAKWGGDCEDIYKCINIYIDR